MSTRTNKRRIYQLFHGRFHGKFLWSSAEEQAWLDVAPVGREFGSPDHERLEILDLYADGRITSDDAMRKLGIGSLEDLHQQMLAADLSTPRPNASATLKGMFAGQVTKSVTIANMNKAISQYLDMGKGELVVILDLYRTTATRRAEKDQPLPLHSAENVLRLRELKSMANDTFESEEAAFGWLLRPHPMLDGETPLESAKTSFGARRVKDILVAIKYGGAV